MLIDIRAERLNRGWTLEDGAKRFDITVSALSLIERGLRRPTPRIAFEIASTYGYKRTDIWPTTPTTEPGERAA